MGMTDRQFDSYQARLLEHLEEILEQLQKEGTNNKKLERLIENIKQELKRP